jgi:diguanylate cyclase (GGDEF)-like protein/PAS domain S-box-containing protein
MYLSNAMGMLLIVPLALSWAARGTLRADAEIALLTALTAAASVVVFVLLTVPLVWVALLVPAVAGLRHGVRGASAAILPWVLLGVVTAGQRRGLYAATTDSVVDAIRFAQASTGMGVLVTGSVGALSAQLRSAMRRLRRSEERVRLLVEGVRDHAMFMLDAELRVAAWNAGAERMLGYCADDVVGRHVDVLLSRAGSGERPLDISPLSAGSEQERWVARGDGATFLGRFAAYPVREGGDGAAAFAVVVRDVTESRRVERRLRHMALHDSLTGLPNRTLLQDRLTMALVHARREDRRVAVLFCDLDRFKVINDSLGHAVGDEVIRQVAERLEGIVRPGDTVARFGGDEFVFCCEDVRDAAEAVAISRRIEAELKRPLLVGQELIVTASIGIAIADGEASPDALLRDADAAMYRAKRTGHGHALTDAGDHDRALERLRGETEIRRAVERRELVLHYQPIVELATGKPVAVEALLRWNHPVRGLLPPCEFIRVAEDTGAIVEIGQWVLEEACAALHRLRQESGEDDLRVNVNVSARQLREEGFAETVGATLGRTGTDPRGVVLELTETTLVEDLPVNQSVLASLKRLGVHIAMDDFGIGYSSLAYLRRLPIDQIKLDRSFVAELDDAGGGAPILRAAVAMAQALAIDVVAEGVERGDQVGVLGALGYRYGQGFHFARPAAEADVAAQLLRGRGGRGRSQRLRLVGGGPA